jgi:ABC-type nitrate/sulfonate/bicarbonate transport system substrate-binding protein
VLARLDSTMGSVVANLATDPNFFDLAANAETQGLGLYATHRNLRLIYFICEVAYRLVAKKRKVSKLSDLKRKKIGTFPGSSAGVFIHNMLSSVGIADSGYTTVAGNVCMKSPCASNTLPTQLKAGAIDAFGIWEPAVELGIESLGPSNVVVFQNSSVYREVYALYRTTDALNDPGKRKDIVEFVRALNKTLDVFTNMPKEKGIYD